MYRTAISLAWAILLVGCTDRPGGAGTSEQAIAVTNEFMEANLPQVDLTKMIIQTADLDNRWRVSYDYPDGSTGGPAIFLVEKKSGKILDVKIEQ